MVKSIGVKDFLYINVAAVRPAQELVNSVWHFYECSLRNQTLVKNRDAKELYLMK